MFISNTGTLPKMRTIRQAAADSGLAVCHIKRLIDSNKIVYIRTGKKYLINFDTLVKYLQEGEGAAER